jgi:hypothetical protein
VKSASTHFPSFAHSLSCCHQRRKTEEGRATEDIFNLRDNINPPVAQLSFRIAVAQLDRNTGEMVCVHESMNAAARAVGGGVSAISLCCSEGSVRKIACGFKWRKATPEEAKSTSVFVNPVGERPSVKTVAQSENSRSGAKSKAATQLDGRSQRKKFVEKPLCEERNLSWHQPQKNEKAVAKLDLDSEDILSIHVSGSEAARVTGGNPVKISQCCSFPGKHKTHLGFKWRFATNEESFRLGRSLPVAQLDLSSEEVLCIHSSIRTAARAVGVDSMCISNCCSGKQKTSCGFKWQKVTCELANATLGLFNHAGGRQKMDKAAKQCVAQLDLSSGNVICVHTSLKAAANAVDGNSAYISACCTGNHKSAYGFKWRKVTPDDEEATLELPKPAGRASKCQEVPPIGGSSKAGMNAKAIAQLDLKSDEVICVHASGVAAARAIDGSASMISQCCAGAHKSHLGFKWRFATRKDAETTEGVTICNLHVAQLSLASGQVVSIHRSMAAAGHALGVDPSSISKCCAGKLKAAFGFKWRKAAREEARAALHNPEKEEKKTGKMQTSKRSSRLEEEKSSLGL